MKNLIPYFIAEKYQKGQYNGRFNGISLFVDISGFTSITNKLMKQDKEGAEIMSDIINRIFEPSVNSVYRNKGFVTHFAGDAFVAVFPSKNKNHLISALCSAIEIRDLLIRMGSHQTKFGCFELSIKIGISFGEIQWGIIDNQEQNAYFFRGAAIDGSANCEKVCPVNSIVFDKPVKFNPGFFNADYVKIKNGYFKLKSLKVIKSSKGRIKPVSPNIQKNFYDEAVLKKPSYGEFREVISCFISFNPQKTSTHQIKLLINNARKFGGYFNNVNYGDKGAFALVFFGIPFATERFAEKACDFLISLYEIEGFEFKAGASLGKVYSGFRGSRKRAEYVCLGSAVNLAARLMVECDLCKITTERNLKKRIENNYHVKYHRSVSFKGFNKKINTFLLLEKKTVPFFEEYSTPFFGRKKELSILLKKLSLLENGKPTELVAIIGEAGIGKSRLVNEFKSKIKKNTVSILFQPDKTLRTSLNPFTSNIKKLVFGDIENKKVGKMTAFERFISSTADTLTNRNSRHKELAEKLFKFKSYLARLASVKFSDNETDNTDPSIHYENTIEAITLLYQAIAEIYPSVFIFEDLHYFDEDSMYALSKIIRRLSKNSSLILITLRPDDRILNEMKTNFVILEITLQSLDKISQISLIKKTATREIETDSIKTILERTSGNPLYIEYLTKVVSDYIHKENFKSIQDVMGQIPEGINEIIYSKFDTLEIELKEAIITASVLGNDFEDHLCKNTLPKKFKKHWKKILIQGELENIWIKSSKATHRFRHALIQESIYEMQSRRKLQIIHMKAGLYIEKSVGKNPDYHPILAYHFENCQNKRKAALYLESSADKAYAKYENSNAIGYYTRLKKIINDPKKKIETNMKIAKILFNTGKTEEAVSIYRSCLKTLKKNNYINLLAECHKELGVISSKKTEYKEAQRQYSIADKLYSQINDKIGRGKILLNTGNNLLRINEYEKAEDIYKIVIKSISASEDAYLISSAFQGIAQSFSQRQQFIKALSYLRKSLILYRKLKDKPRIVQTQINIANIFFKKGELNKSEKILLKSKKNCEMTGFKEDLAYCLNSLASIYIKKKKYDKSISLYNKIADLCDDICNIDLKHIVLFNTGLAYFRSHNYLKALDLFKMQMQIAKFLDNPNYIYKAMKHIALVHEKTGDYNKALKGYKKCLTLSKKSADIKRLAVDFNNVGEIYLFMNDIKNADKFLQKAEVVAHSIGFKHQLCIILKNRAKVFFNSSLIHKSKEYNNISRAIAQEIAKIDVIFETTLLDAKITACENKEKALIILNDMLKSNFDEGQLAEVKSEIYKLIGHEEFKIDAIKTFRKLYLKNTDLIYLKKIDGLNEI